MGVVWILGCCWSFFGAMFPLSCRSGFYSFLDLGLAVVDWVRGGLSNSYGRCLVKHCGIRTAGEALFFCSQKKYPKKAVATPGVPVKDTGVPIEAWRVTCCTRTHPRKACGLRQAGTENSCYPSCLNGLANARKGQKKITKSKTKTKNDFEFVSLHKVPCRQWPAKTPGTKKPLFDNYGRPTKEHRFWLWLFVHFSKPFRRWRYHGLSVPAVWASSASSGAAW